MPANPTNPVQSVDRAFGILEAMADAGGEVGLSELAGDLRLPVPTLHRLLKTLMANGYVRQSPSRKYALGPRLVRLGESANRLTGVWVRPVLASLVEATGETANMATLDGDRMVYVAQVPSPHSMRMFTEVGRRVYLHSTGVGKAVMAQMPETRVRRMIERTGLPAQTERSVTGIDSLLAELADVRTRGYAVDDGEQELGVRCYAVAVPDAHVPTAISISGPAVRLTGDMGARVVPLLQRAAQQLAVEAAR